MKKLIQLRKKAKQERKLMSERRKADLHADQEIWQERVKHIQEDMFQVDSRDKQCF